MTEATKESIRERSRNPEAVNQRQGFRRKDQIHAGKKESEKRIGFVLVNKRLQ